MNKLLIASCALTASCLVALDPVFALCVFASWAFGWYSVRLAIYLDERRAQKKQDEGLDS